mgnify:CR=1 FL=1
MNNSSKFFENRDCQFFPCHKLEGDFNCLFCYCPLYEKNPCPGKPVFIKKEDGRILKNCTDCTFPHRPENYERIMSFLRTKRPPLEFTAEYHHGGEDFGPCTERSRDAGEKSFLDFSVNTNPLGLPEGVKDAIKNSIELCEKYPDQSCALLRKKIEQNCHFGSVEFLTFGNGASELLSLSVRAISPKKTLIFSPTFSGYERALKACGSEIFYHNLQREKNFVLNESIFESIKKASPDMIFLCNPNNPTGQMINPLLLKEILDFCEKNEIFVLIDECFIEFTGKSEESAVRFLKTCPHLLVLNAFTKIYAMAGLRLGYLMSSNFALIKKINLLKPEWNVSQIAQIAGIAALEEKDYVKKTQELIKEERAYLSKKLKALGFIVYPSEANFILFNDQKISEKKYAGKSLDKYLLEKGISLRTCENFKNLTKNDFRIAVRTHGENERLISLL